MAYPLGAPLCDPPYEDSPSFHTPSVPDVSNDCRPFAGFWSRREGARFVCAVAEEEGKCESSDAESSVFWVGDVPGEYVDTGWNR